MEKILIQNHQKKAVSTLKIRKKIKQILNGLGYKSYEISVLITDNETIKQLNSDYRGIAEPTNVLAFSMTEGDFSCISPGVLGDVVISSEVAQKEAETGDITLDERISQLLIHGILHLLGFDHEKSEKEALLMEQKSLELIRLIEHNRSLNYF